MQIRYIDFRLNNHPLVQARCEESVTESLEETAERGISAVLWLMTGLHDADAAAVTVLRRVTCLCDFETAYKAADCLARKLAADSRHFAAIAQRDRPAEYCVRAAARMVRAAGLGHTDHAGALAAWLFPADAQAEAMAVSYRLGRAIAHWCAGCAEIRAAEAAAS